MERIHDCCHGINEMAVRNKNIAYIAVLLLLLLYSRPLLTYFGLNLPTCLNNSLEHHLMHLQSPVLKINLLLRVRLLHFLFESRRMNNLHPRTNQVLLLKLLHRLSFLLFGSANLQDLSQLEVVHRVSLRIDGLAQEF